MAALSHGIFPAQTWNKFGFQSIGPTMSGSPSSPKLMEYNGDTPSLLLESARVQKEWFTDKYG